MALASDGSLYTWGGGKYGQLGHASLQAVQLMVPNQAIVLASPQKVSMLEPALLQPWKRYAGYEDWHKQEADPVLGHLPCKGVSVH